MIHFFMQHRARMARYDGLIAELVRKLKAEADRHFSNPEGWTAEDEEHRQRMQHILRNTQETQQASRKSFRLCLVVALITFGAIVYTLWTAFKPFLQLK